MTESIESSCEIRPECFNELEPQPASNEKTNRRNYRQIYRKEWETNPLFKGEVIAMKFRDKPSQINGRNVNFVMFNT